jgi:APA family basic amino acid/polyamine antiporter
LVFFAAIGLLYIIFNVGLATANFSPFSPLGIGSFGSALVLIFWAYSGFEISTIPADEINDPGKTIPKAIILGISIVTIFYLITNIVLFGVRPWNLLSLDKAPLTAATSVILGSIPTLGLVGVIIVGVGALISVSGSDESGMIGTSSLGLALAADGLFPRVFARMHPRFKTPYLGIIIQAVTALVAALIGNLSVLIATSVFFMAVAYAATCASPFFLRRKGAKAMFNLRGGLLIPILGVIFSIYLITQCSFTQIALGIGLLFVGIPIYIKYSPKKEIAELKEALISRESILKRTEAQEERFLAHVLQHIKRLYRRNVGKKQTPNENK